MCTVAKVQKQSLARALLLIKCSAVLQQIYRRTPMQNVNLKKPTVHNTFCRGTPLGDCFWCFYKDTPHFLYLVKCCSHELLHIKNIIKDPFAQAECQKRTS